MHYGLGTAGRCCICAGQTLRVHSPDNNTFLPEMTWPHLERMASYQSTHICLKNVPAEFHPDPT